MTTPTAAAPAENSTENLKASRFWPRKASRIELNPKCPFLFLSASEKTLIAGTIRNSVMNAKKGIRPSQAQLFLVFEDAAGAALSVRPPTAVVMVVATSDFLFDADQESATIGPQLSVNTLLAAAIWAGVMNLICEIRLSGGKFALSAVVTLPASSSCW